MSYGAALPAGAYGGALGAYRRRRTPASNQGAAMRGAAMERAVTLGGIGALGDPNLCTDTGWAAARALIGGTSTLIGGAYAAPTTTKVAGSTKTTTSGGGAGYYAAQGVSTVVSAWDAACVAEIRQQDMTASARNTELLAAQMAADRAAQARLIEQNRTDTERMLSAMMAPRAPAPTSGVDTNTLLIGGGILAAVIVGAVILRR